MLVSRRDNRLVKATGDMEFIETEILGEGGYGKVYRGSHKGEPIAVKEVWRHLHTLETDFEKLQLSHQNIVRYFAKKELNDFMYIGMELCSGSLEDLIQKNTYPSFAMRDMLLQAAIGLEFLHSRNIIHRDITTGNILYSTDVHADTPIIKLADFGLSKIKPLGVDEFTLSITTNGTRRGSAEWAPPEFHRYSKLTLEADVFSLGCVFGYALTNSHPFGETPMLRPANIIAYTISWEKENVLDKRTKWMVRQMIREEPEKRLPLREAIAELTAHHGEENCVSGTDSSTKEILLTTEVNSHFISPAQQSNFSSSSKEISVGKLKVYNKQLGQGGTSQVFKGLLDDKEVAVKRLLRENRTFESNIITSEIQHENIIRHIAQEENGIYSYLVMEICAATLEDWIRGKYTGRHPGLMEGILLQATHGLSYLHSITIVHRDIKPQNILISLPQTLQRPVIKLADFSLSIREHEEERTAISKARKNTGTIGWTAPEVYNIESESVFGYPADIFSLGCVFGYALTGGSHPFRLKSAFYLVIDNIKKGIIDWDREHFITNEKMKSLIKRMIHQEPKERPALSAVATQLSEWIDIQDPRPGRLQELCFNMDLEKESELVGELHRSVDDQLDLNFTDNLGRNLLMLLFARNEENLEDHIQERKDSLRRQCAEILLSDNVINSSTMDMKQKDHDGANALHYLCQNYKGIGISEIAKKMINLGIDVNETTATGCTAIRLASQYYGNSKRQGSKLFDLLRLLMEKGADPNRADSDGWAVLHLICKFSRNEDLPEIVDLLLRNGADPNSFCRSPNGSWNAFHLACKHYDGENLDRVVRIFLDHDADVRLEDSGGATVLKIACANGGENLFEVVKHLLSCGADPNRQNFSISIGTTALHNLCKHYKKNDLLAIVHIFFDYGANPKLQPSNNWTALHFACKYYKNALLPQVVQLLLDRGVDPNVQAARSGSTALILIPKYYKNENLREIIRLFLEKGGNPNIQNSHGWTVLHKLCRYYDKENLHEIVQMLLVFKADPLLRTSNYEEAPERKGVVSFQFLAGYYAGRNICQIMRMLIDAANSITNVDDYGENALHWLCRFNSKQPLMEQAIAFLVENGIDINSKNGNGSNALLLTCQYHEHESLLDVAKILIDQGINVGDKDNDGHDATHYLKQRNLTSEHLDALLVTLRVAM